MKYDLKARPPIDQTPDNFKDLETFGFSDPAKSLIKEDAVKLNRNFYPDETKEKEQIDILKAELENKA